MKTLCEIMLLRRQILWTPGAAETRLNHHNLLIQDTWQLYIVNLQWGMLGLEDMSEETRVTDVNASPGTQRRHPVRSQGRNVSLYIYLPTLIFKYAQKKPSIVILSWPNTLIKKFSIILFQTYIVKLKPYQYLLMEIMIVKYLNAFYHYEINKNLSILSW